MVIDSIAAKQSVRLKKPFLKRYKIGKGRIEGEEFALVQPLTYMNNSGSIFPGLLRTYGGEKSTVLVIVDNMDLPEGTCRIKKGGSSSTHNGLKSISTFCSHNHFLRLFVGIGKPEKRDDIISYVLSRPDPDHYLRMVRGVERAAEAALKLVHRPLEEVMNEYNQRTDT